MAPVRCPPTWDGWQCWEEGGSPGRIEYRACPSYIYFNTGTANDGGQLMQNTCGSEYFKTALSSPLSQVLKLPLTYYQQKNLSFSYPPASWEVANSTERKNLHTPVYGVKEFISLSVRLL